MPAWEGIPARPDPPDPAQPGHGGDSPPGRWRKGPAGAGEGAGLGAKPAQPEDQVLAQPGNWIGPAGAGAGAGLGAKPAQPEDQVPAQAGN
jgi:hypothetical protein